jgi:hypothetical protein
VFAAVHHDRLRSASGRIDSLLLKCARQVTFIGKVKTRVRLRMAVQVVWLLHVRIIPHRRQEHSPPGHAGRADVLCVVCGLQLLCARATGKHLRAAEGGPAGSHRRHATAGELIRSFDGTGRPPPRLFHTRLSPEDRRRSCLNGATPWWTGRRTMMRPI